MSKHSPKLKILQFICSSGFYGAERWVLALANNMDLSAVQLDLATSREAGAGEAEIKKHFESDYQHIGKAFEVPMSHRFDFKVVDRLVDIIKERQIDIIHTHGYKSDIIGVLAAKKAGIKCLITPHGYVKSTDLKLKLFIWLGCKAIKYADRVAPLSRELVAKMREFGVAEERMTYIQNGVDLSEIDILNPAAKPSPDKKRIGYIGQLIARKNISDMLETFSLLASKHDNLELLLLGDGDVRASLEDQARNLPGADRIRFLGFVENRFDYLKTLDLFVMTSRVEGIPRCMMEAMAMGIPVSAYNISGVDQLIEDEITGLMAPYGDKQRLASQWERILFDQELARSLSCKAQKLVLDEFSAARMADDYLQLYRNMLN